jgi:hypothetical protein
MVCSRSSKRSECAVVRRSRLTHASRADAIRRTLHESLFLPLLTSLLTSPSPPLLVPVLGILEQLATDLLFTPELDDSLLAPVVQHLKSTDQQVQLQATRTLFQLSDCARLRPALVWLGALDPLVQLLVPSTAALLIPASSSVARFGLDATTLATLVKLNAYGRLASLLLANKEDTAVATVVAEALGTAAAGSKDGRKAVRESGALKTLVGLLASTNAGLLCNVAYVLGKCSEERELSLS